MIEAPVGTCSRDTLRRQLRLARRALSPHTRSLAAEQTACYLAQQPLFYRSRRIACYVANDGEIDPLPVLLRAWRMDKVCYLPVIRPSADRRMWFAPYREGDALALNTYGIAEPVYASERLLPPWALDLILTPLVAFDVWGHRLGMGGGYYDRTFAYLRRRRYWHKPRLVGLAFAFQQVEELPQRPWDVPLQAVATDQGVIALRRDGASTLNL
jgi:5-formyltetrahydrofolate cyclo-ligase